MTQMDWRAFFPPKSVIRSQTTRLPFPVSLTRYNITSQTFEVTMNPFAALPIPQLQIGFARDQDAFVVCVDDRFPTQIHGVILPAQLESSDSNTFPDPGPKHDDFDQWHLGIGGRFFRLRK